MTHYECSINLLEQLTELRKTFYLLDLHFITKKNATWGLPDEEMNRARYWADNFKIFSRHIT